MEKPDEKGFVHITWPSRNIPYGGIFHTKVVEPSENQQQFVKLLLEESKLDIAQRRKSAYNLRQENDTQQTGPASDSYVHHRPMVRPRTSKRRSLSAIRESGVFEMDPYQPLKRGQDRDHLKDVLAHIMQYGESPEQPPTRVPTPPKAKPANVLPTPKEQWHELMSQIRERAEWLAEMEDLGQAAPHRQIIHEQIGQRMRALKALDLGSISCRSSVNGSGCSTMRSREPTPRSQQTPVQTTRSAGSQGKQKSAQNTPKTAGSKDNLKSAQSNPKSAESQEKQKSAQSNPRSAESQEKLKSAQSNPKSVGSRVSRQSKQSTKVPVKDEHISAFNKGSFTPLEYTPRRRV